MQTVQTLLLVVQVLVAVCLIGFILLQHGRGADAGAAFGSGASATVFGARGTGNFFSRATAALAFIFLANSLALGYIATERIRNQQSLMATGAVTSSGVDDRKEVVPEQTEAPVTEESEVPALPEE